jgi:hypothetical protein
MYLLPEVHNSLRTQLMFVECQSSVKSDDETKIPEQQERMSSSCPAIEESRPAQSNASQKYNLVVLSSNRLTLYRRYHLVSP